MRRDHPSKRRKGKGGQRRHKIYPSCFKCRKVAFPSEGVARGAADRIEDAEMRVYECSSGNWHLTTEPKRSF